MTAEKVNRTWLITIGDPAGSSPELLEHLLDAKKPTERLIIFGPEAVNNRLQLDIPGFDSSADRPRSFWFSAGEFAEDSVLSGTPDSDSGRAALAALDTALEFSQKNPADGLLTLPLSKQAVRLEADSNFTGHTEHLEAFWDSQGVMSFFGKSFNVALVTRHIPLERVPQTLTCERIVDQVRVLDKFYKNHGRKNASFALLGLNPHAGEGGMIGRAESELLSPAVTRLSDRGINVTGPHPADSYLPVHAQKNDMIVSCYHDQGLTPFKLLHFFTGVHVTAGLPLLRVSPGHGVAASLAGQGEVDPRSAVNCLKWLREWSSPEAED